MKRKSLITGISIGLALVAGIGTLGAITSTSASVETDAHIDTQLPAYSWKEQLLAKITGFEGGYTCPVCQFYIASACVNRMNSWYGGDPVAMVTDKNDEYYMMNPVYAELDCIEVNGWNYYDHAAEMLEVVREAEQRTADIWYWDNANTQGAWADLVYCCMEDGMYFYK